MRFRTHRRMRPNRAFSAAFVGGIVAGLVLWSVQMSRSRRDLFSPNPLRRLAALGYLAGQSGIETAQILTEYVRWEQKPVLLKKARRLLSRMQRRLA